MDDYTDDVTAASTSTKSSKPGAAADTEDFTAAIPGGGPLLEKDAEAVIKMAEGFWEDLEPVLNEKMAHWKANKARRAGIIGVHVVKPDPDKAEWKVWAPPGAAKVPPTFNKPARLCRRLKSNMFVDPPLPEATPGGASDNEDPDAAEFQTRILQDVTTSEKFHVGEIAEASFDLAETYDSAFARVYVDPRGNGFRPKRIQASQTATSVADALYVNGDGVTPQPTPYVTRYVKDDDTLTDDPSMAALEWLPGLRHELLTGRNLRPIPATATTVEDASGVILRAMVKLGILRNQYPAVFAEMSIEEQWELVGQKPPKAGDLVEPNQKEPAKRESSDDEPPPDHLSLAVTTIYMGQGGEYKYGAYVVILGTKKLAHRQEWCAEVNGVKEALPVPIAHFKGWSEGESTFYGYHMMHFLGPGGEVRAATIGGALEHLDRFNRRKVFYTPQSLFQPKMAPAAMGVMVPVQQGSKPEVEKFPEYPRVGMELTDRATAELDDESSLAPIAQGQTDPSVQSGLHAQRIIEQVNIGLGDIKRSTDKAIVRLYNISAAFIRAYFTTSQQIRYRGDDQEYKQKEWTNADLSDTKDVRILKGSFTMLAPSAKLSVAEYMRKLNLIDDNQLRGMAAGNIGGLMGLQDDPALLRIRRQISLWMDGPPKAESPAEQVPDAYPGESGPQSSMAPAMPETPAQDPAVVGSIPPAVPPAPDPIEVALANIFKPAANDEEPAIAAIRFRELSRAMCSKKYERQPEAWRAGFDAVYQAARKAAGVGTAREQAENQAAAQKAAEAAELAKRQADTQGKVATIGAQAQATLATKGGTDKELKEMEIEADAVNKGAELESREADSLINAQVEASRPKPAAAGAR